MKTRLWKEVQADILSAHSLAEETKVVYKGKSFTVKNNPNTGKMDMFDNEGNHIGQAPSVETATDFIKKQVDAGRLVGEVNH